MFLRAADTHGRDAEKNLDLRIRKTRRAIRSGLITACQAKPYAHVSVTDICAASMVSRTTFYDHYTDKDALLAEVVSYLLEDITPAIESMWLGGGDGVAQSRRLADFYARNGRALTTLLCIRGGDDGDLSERLRQMYRSVFRQWAKGRVDDSVLPLASEVYASVALTLIERGSTKPPTEEELVFIDRMRSLFAEGIGAS
ncbi:TetR family transcriptional regulator [Actinomyces sp. HMSC062G12]|nr:TetR family transcriptional regulator [Actinomyces sp. HMSC062G12]